MNQYKVVCLSIVASLLVSGCELLGPELHKKIPLQSVDKSNLPDDASTVEFQELSNQAIDEGQNAQIKPRLYPGNNRFFVTPKPTLKRAGKANGEFNLNFDDADLGEVAKVILSDILHENYVLSPKVAGKVTLQTSKPLTREELLPTLEMILQINNAALTYQDGVYQIRPRSEALGSGALTAFSRFKGKLPSGYQVHIIPVKYVAAQELVDVIKPLLQSKTVLHVDNNRNLILAAGTASELRRITEMVSTFDVDMMKGRSFGLFPLKNVEAEKIITELEQVFNQSEGDAGKKLIKFIPIERLNSLLAITRQASQLKQIEAWIYRLDRANTTAGGGVNVYRVQHVDAVKLAETMNEIFSQSKKSKAASIAAGRKAVKVTNKKTGQTRTILRNTAKRTLADVGDIKIIADEPNNSLVVVATAQDYAVVQRVIKKLDVMPLQVLIDATIVEVTLTDDLKYGIEWYFNHQNGGDNNITGGGNLFNNITSLGAAAVTGGFGYSFISRSQDIKAILSATAKDKKINVISSPSLMVLNNQEASMQVGDEVPIRTSQSTNTSSNTNGGVIQTSSIQQRKTGIKLKVKPRVNASGLVIMEINQSVENASNNTVSGIDSPTISTREFTSSVAVQSGETVVLGGLIKDDNTYDKNGVPFLHELPLIGPLFGSTTRNKVKTELVVLITPRVVISRQSAREITNEFQRKLTGIYDKPEKDRKTESGEVQ